MTGFNHKSCLYFQFFWRSKLLNGCTVVIYVCVATYVFVEYNYFQGSKSIFMISVFKIFPIMLLRQLNFGVLSVYQLPCVYYKEKSPLFLNLRFLLLLSELGMPSEG